MKNALSYHLAFALIQLIRQSSEGIYHRLNLTVLILDCVKAMKPEAKGLDEVQESTELLRTSYEPEMDLNQYTYAKRVAFEIELDKAQADLLKIINDDQLVTSGIMQEIIAGNWSDEGKGKSKPKRKMDQKIQM